MASGQNRFCSLANVLRPESPELAGLRDYTEAGPHSVPQPVNGQRGNTVRRAGGDVCCSVSLQLNVPLCTGAER
ncbi:hypothetical protein PBY51_000031 [Eleginops maclovinus]|uniref:Uncharacterized protein n=1 Tax=Eleginops maclovinus TaxID=56733 RepID=A0AAN7XEQ7_ELEMC|nr:hypothetical protein PBY51_000031 [Eleginops maclovinus]